MVRVEAVVVVNPVVRVEVVIDTGWDDNDEDGTGAGRIGAGAGAAPARYRTAASMVDTAEEMVDNIRKI